MTTKKHEFNVGSAVSHRQFTSVLIRRNLLTNLLISYVEKLDYGNSVLQHNRLWFLLDSGK